MPITVGTVEVHVIPNTQGILTRLRNGILPAANTVGTEAGQQMGNRLTQALQVQVVGAGVRIGRQLGEEISRELRRAVRDALPDTIRTSGKLAAAQGGRAGAETGGAFSRELKTRVEAAVRSLPNIKVGANTSEAESDLQALRVRMETLRDKRIGIDIGADEARIEAESLEAELRRLGAISPNVRVQVDTARAIAELEAMREQIRLATLKPWEVRLEVDGGFGARLRAAVQAAQASLPNINIDSNTTPARARIQGLRAELEQLRDVRIGIDIDAGAAQAKIDQIRAELAKLGMDKNVDLDVRVDATNARRELKAVELQADILDRKRIDIPIHTSSAMSNILQLAAALATVIVPPAIGVLAAGLGAVTSAAFAAAAGIGLVALVAVPGIMKITAALQAQKAANEAAATAAGKSGAAAAQQAIQAQQQALQMEGAEQSLTQAYRSAAQQREQALRQVSAAQRAVGDAQAQAVERTRQAEQQLVDAQNDARRTQIALTDARKAARLELEDMQSRLAGAALDERSAVLAVERAQQRLDATRQAGASVSRLDREEAQLAYDEAVQRLEDQRRDNSRLQESAAAATKAGVEGSDQVVKAKEAVAQADRRAVEAAAGVRSAQTEGARAVADAQQQLADAHRNAAESAQQSADQIASAQRGIQSAQLAAAAAAQQSAGGMDAAATAAQKYQDALAKMNPATRSTFEAVLRLKDAFKAWSDAASPTVMPLFTRFVDGLTRTLPTLTPMVMAAADGIGRLMDRASRSFARDPFWASFKADLTVAMPRAIEGVGVSFGNLFRGIAGIFDAFNPHMDSIASRMEKATGRFANWGTQLKGSPEFERFLDNASRNAPLLKEAFAAMGRAILAVSNALAPLRGPALVILTAVAEFVATLARNLPGVVQFLVLYAIAWRAVNTAMAINAALSAATPMGLIITAIAAVIAVILLLILHWDKVEAVFRWVWEHGIRPVFQAIADAAGVMWRNGIKPVVDALVAGWNAVAEAANWLWRKVLSPAFEGIGIGARILAAIVLVVLIAPLLIAFRALAAIAMFLWHDVFEPVWVGIGLAADWAWRNILKPTIDGIGGALGWVGDRLGDLWHGVFEPAWTGLSMAADWAWRNILKPTIDGIGAGIDWTGDRLDALWHGVFEPAWAGIAAAVSWAWTGFLSPTFNAITGGMQEVGSWAQDLYQVWIKPWFDKIGAVVGDTMTGAQKAFRVAIDGISLLWGFLKEIVAAPVRFVVNQVYDKGIKKVWNWVADKVGLPALPDGAAGFATGGIYPGYTPGRDIGLAAVSGGEAIMRPEWTRAVGPGFVNSMNAAARSGGVAGVRSALSTTPIVGAYSWGGIVGSVVDTVKAGIDAIPGASWVLDKGASLARGFLAGSVELAMKPVRALIGEIPGDTAWSKVARGLPNKAIDGVIDWIREDDRKQAFAGVGVAASALREAMTYAGVPYLWGGTSRLGIDCSGLTQAAYRAVGVEIGRTTYDQVKRGRHIAMQDAVPGDLVFEQFAGPSPSHVGLYMGPGRLWNAPKTGDVVRESAITNVVDVRRMAEDVMGGSVGAFGDLAGWLRTALAATGKPADWLAPLMTIAKNESGGNPRAENHYDSNQRYGGTFGLMQMIPPTFNAYKLPGMDDILNAVHNAVSAIRYISARYGTPFNTPGIRSLSAGGGYVGYKSGGIVPLAFDSGGYLPPGLNLTYNGTARPEPVFTGAQADALFSGVRGGDGEGSFVGELRLSSGEFLGMVDGRIRRSHDDLANRAMMGRG
ncbi:NlpC/P60 family protein [Embleya sp. NPDC059237]|uniref:NlpC/P60 family protein n=1 Tax=Embleya sp. NPDC059237 TaxID=3346784 RepID=UPI00368A4BE6